MSDSDDDESRVTRIIDAAVDRSRKELDGFTRAIEARVPEDGKLKLKTPHPFRWPDGRKLRFTHLVREGRHIFMTAGQAEKARIDILDTSDLEALAKRITGFRFPNEDATNVVRFPNKNG